MKITTENLNPVRSLIYHRRPIKDGQKMILFKEDQRPLVKRPDSKNKLPSAERKEIVKVSNSKKFADLPVSQIISKLASQDKYIASEPTFIES